MFTRPRHHLIAAALACIVSQTIFPPLTGAAPSDHPRAFASIADAVNPHINNHEVTGAVTLVATKEGILHLQAHGFADAASQTPMRTDAIFRIASMTKPCTAIAILILQDEGQLSIHDPVSKYIPDFSDLKTPAGDPANLTISHLLSHTAGLVGPGKEETEQRTLEQLAHDYAMIPMVSAPGEKWMYTRVNFNLAARIVEVVSSVPFDVFLKKRIFAPLGMTDTTYFPSVEQQSRVVTSYYLPKGASTLVAQNLRTDYAPSERPPQGAGGLYSTAADYARLTRMLLDEGELDGVRILSPEAVRQMRTPLTGDLSAGFVPGCAWGIGVGIVQEPQGVTEALSPGTFGHCGGFGTQAWIDPQKSIVYILMMQRSSLPNVEDIPLRRDFQNAAAAALQEVP